MIATILGWGLAAVLWILGSRNYADWFPDVEQHIGRKLYFSEKARLVLAWPFMTLAEILTGDDEDNA